MRSNRHRSRIRHSRSPDSRSCRRGCPPRGRDRRRVPARGQHHRSRNPGDSSRHCASGCRRTSRAGRRSPVARPPRRCRSPDDLRRSQGGRQKAITTEAATSEANAAAPEPAASEARSATAEAAPGQTGAAAAETTTADPGSTTAEAAPGKAAAATEPAHTARTERAPEIAAAKAAGAADADRTRVRAGRKIGQGARKDGRGQENLFHRHSLGIRENGLHRFPPAKNGPLS
ncbi:protein of unknown function [Methylorubrum extorquens]|uniref:Uncharacterized protein n=1 Tax=Methylorubrum extorquens TaxID=408 RepID=A0A2N9AP37_METEX|nr:protein of unknown function [Methylorubrum extorquens]